VQTQKDHVEAYSFLIGRMTAALITGDASYREVPAKRTWTGLLIGVALAALIAGGCVIFGLIEHSRSPAPAPAPAPSGSVIHHVRLVPSGPGDLRSTPASRSIGHAAQEGRP
jgi:hypothetical protein